MAGSEPVRREHRVPGAAAGRVLGGQPGVPGDAAVGFVGFFLSMVAAALVLAWPYLRSHGSILVVAAFHATFDIATTTPTTTTVIPTLMGAVITVAALAVMPGLWAPAGGAAAVRRPRGCRRALRRGSSAAGGPARGPAGCAS